MDVTAAVHKSSWARLEPDLDATHDELFQRRSLERQEEQAIKERKRQQEAEARERERQEADQAEAELERLLELNHEAQTKVIADARAATALGELDHATEILEEATLRSLRQLGVDAATRTAIWLAKCYESQAMYTELGQLFTLLTGRQVSQGEDLLEQLSGLLASRAAQEAAEADEAEQAAARERAEAEAAEAAAAKEMEEAEAAEREMKAAEARVVEARASGDRAAVAEAEAEFELAKQVLDMK